MAAGQVTTVLAAFVVVIAAATACGDNERLPCDLDKPLSLECETAVELALRDSPTLLTTQSNVDRYFIELDRAVQLEPLVGTLLARRHRGTQQLFYNVNTTDPRVISSWGGPRTTGSPVPPTSVAPIDTAMAELHAAFIEGGSQRPDGSYVVPLVLGVWFDEEILESDLQQESPTFLDPPMTMRTDATRYIQGTDIWIDGTFGWGDCAVACFGYRSLRVVYSGNDCRVYDLGGDPLPDYIELAPTTQPWPGSN